MRAAYPACIEQPEVHRRYRYSSGRRLRALDRDAHLAVPRRRFGRLAQLEDRFVTGLLEEDRLHGATVRVRAGGVEVQTPGVASSARRT